MLNPSSKVIAVGLLSLVSAMATSDRWQPVLPAAPKPHALSEDRPSIRVVDSVENSFTISGSHFDSGRVVRIRISNGLMPNQYFSATADENGSFLMYVSGVCGSRGTVRFSASYRQTNSTPGRKAWSKTVTEECRLGRR